MHLKPIRLGIFIGIIYAFPCVVFAQSEKVGLSREPDLYDAIAEIVEIAQASARIDTLPTRASNYTLNMLQDWVADSPNLSLYPGEDHTLVLQNGQPRYLNLFNSNESYSCTIDDSVVVGAKMNFSYSLVDGGILIQDSTFVKLEGTTPRSKEWHENLYKGVWIYKSINLPLVFQPIPPEINPGIELKIHGRDLITIRYPEYAGWYDFINWIMRENLNYSGPQSVVFGESDYEIKYYMLITNPAKSRHHLLVLNHFYSQDAESVQQTNIFANLYPYIRIDNVKSLFSSDKANNSEKRVGVKRGSK